MMRYYSQVSPSAYGISVDPGAITVIGRWDKAVYGVVKVFRSPRVY